jgi:hypothetical protein
LVCFISAAIFGATTGTAAPVLTSPAPGSVLSGSTVSFNWAAGSDVTEYQLWVGSTSGSDNLGLCSGSTTSCQLTGLPTNGSAVYVMLTWEVSGVWLSAKYTYTAATKTTAPVLTSPAPGSVLSGSTVSFAWVAGSGVATYQLWVGSTSGSDNLGLCSGSTTSCQLAGLPTNGSAVYVMLTWEASGAWLSAKYTYTAATKTTVPVLTSPAPGSVLSGSTVDFFWAAGSGVTEYQLWVGSTSGSDNLGLCSGSTTTCKLTGLPTNGTAVYVMLAWEASGTWLRANYFYTSARSTPTLTAVSCANSSISGTTTDNCTVTLKSAAGSGGLAVSLSSSNTKVAVPSSVTVAAGASSASFTATATAVGSAQTATLTASAGGVAQLFVIDLGATAAALKLQSTSVAFGDVTVGSPVYQSVTLTSSGATPLIISAGSVTGAGFTVSPVNLPVTLNPGQTATLQIEFDPTTTGAASGAVTLTSNSSTGASSIINLSGTGESGTYAVNVTWNAPASSEDPIEGYYVYRAVSGSTTYSLMTSTVDTSTTYTDSTVVAGTTYVYYVESVDDQGVKSTPSSPITITVP